ncbi:cytochrome c nitrite reductase small subunit [Luteitalea sp. TBR-22]|uniref:cytochrome c nitrite reductase small subunit n=1 Tax=Luteitalea sp. TBR-22 TaxID=2802971 RepID=UPI001AF47170|nr:cytochrome c nitrite reductase small subunit [Luteitalea sp. TBR-22]BCS35366.1 cytochrome c nitrite reductase small subunit [Luteitalea sp. TBR-22]
MTTNVARSRWAFQWRWALLLSALVGVVVGIGSYTFVYAKGYSYLTNDPAACANCHVMNEQYAGWTRSSHRAVAVCNDCHTPAGHVAKYVTKATNGFWHSFYFTTGWYPDHIRAGRRNKDIAEASCQKCHAPITSAITTGHPGDPAVACVRCHDSVGHLR